MSLLRKHTFRWVAGLVALAAALLGAVTVTSLTAQAAGPTLQLSQEGPFERTDQVEIVGLDFTPSSTYSLEVTGGGSTTTLSQDSYQTNAQGQFAHRLRLGGDGWEYGSYSVKATDGAGLSATVTFEVPDPSAAPTPTLVTPEPSPFMPNDTIQIVGSNFAANSAYTIVLSGPGTTGTTQRFSGNGYTTDANGGFANQLKLQAPWGIGNYAVLVTDASNNSARLSFDVVQQVPSVDTIDQGPFQTTDKVRIVGRDFTANSTYTITLSGPGTTGSTVNLTGADYVTNESGDFARQLSLSDPWEPGNYAILVTDGQGLTARLSFDIEEPAPALAFEEEGPFQSSDTIQINGTAFTPSTAYTIVLSGPGTTGTTHRFSGNGYTTDANGGFSNQLKLSDPWEPGNYAILVTDDQGLSARLSFEVEAPAATPTLETIDQGPFQSTDKIKIVGRDFTANSTYSLVLSGPGTTGSTVNLTGADYVTNENGDFARQLSLSTPWEPGTYAILATDAAGLTARMTFEVAVTPDPVPVVTDVTPRVGPKAGGTVVTITGTNLANVTDVLFGSAEGVDLQVNSEGTKITVKTPSGTGTVDVTLVFADGKTAAGKFTYQQGTTIGLPKSGV